MVKSSNIKRKRQLSTTYFDDDVMNVTFQTKIHS